MALTGRTVPWNTFAVWRVRELALLGFPLVGDGTAEDRGIGGVEVRPYSLYFCTIHTDITHDILYWAQYSMLYSQKSKVAEYCAKAQFTIWLLGFD